jgi:hypothetical protein
MFPPDAPFFYWLAGHAFIIATFMLLLALLFFIWDKKRLMFLFLGCSGSIAFWLHETQDRQFHFDVYLVEDQLSPEVLDKIHVRDATYIVFETRNCPDHLELPAFIQRNYEEKRWLESKQGNCFHFYSKPNVFFPALVLSFFENEKQEDVGKRPYLRKQGNAAIVNGTGEPIGERIDLTVKQSWTYESSPENR